MPEHNFHVGMQEDDITCIDCGAKADERLALDTCQGLVNFVDSRRGNKEGERWWAEQAPVMHELYSWASMAIAAAQHCVNSDAAIAV